MQITLESVQKDRKKYDAYAKRILQERDGLMKQLTGYREKYVSLDALGFAKSQFEQAEIQQKINELTRSLQNNRLTLEQIDLQQSALEKRIDEKTFADGMVANRRAKTELSQIQEIGYCQDEIAKCEAGIRLYSLLGDVKNVQRYRESLKTAEEQLKYAQSQTSNTKTTAEMLTKNQESCDNSQGSQGKLEGHLLIEKNGLFLEQWQQVLKNESGKEVGTRIITEKTDLEKGTKSIETIGKIKTDDAEISLKETSSGVGDGLQLHRKDMTRVDSTTGEKEQFVYDKQIFPDGRERETYFKVVGGKKCFEMYKSATGTIEINTFENGQPIDCFAYDENGKAIDGMCMPGMDQLKAGDEEFGTGYIEHFFDSQVPKFECEFRKIDTKELGENLDLQSILNNTILTQDQGQEQ